MLDKNLLRGRAALSFGLMMQLLQDMNGHIATGGAMTDDDRIEIIAQSLWLGMFGVTAISAEWQQWATDHPNGANEYRDRAREMFDVHSGHTQANASHHSSLGWLP